tara:strand:+ start:211 stop:528 length:318 start_codon:yes stop_codon:yes gene_type:complete
MSKKKIKTKLKISSYSIILCIVLGLGIITFNDFGLLQLFDLYQKEKKLYVEVNELLIQQDNLQFEINRLQTDEKYIQKIAREKFMMVLPGEKVYRVQDEKIIDSH